MNVPRFNAEAALYRPSKNYRLPANRPYLTANPGVQPAALTKPIVQSIRIGWNVLTIALMTAQMTGALYGAARIVHIHDLPFRKSYITAFGWLGGMNEP